MRRAMKPFKLCSPEQLEESAFRLIGRDWMLITAGGRGAWNTMTASWGALGVLWNRPAAFIFVRPGRYTFEFIEREPLFTLSFFDPAFHSALEYCGTHSGRDGDKAAATGLTPFEPGPGVTAFEEARLILVCRKLYHQDVNPGFFLDPGIAENYPKKDYHRMYAGEVIRMLTA